MTKKHIIIAGAAIAALMAVYPPWVNIAGWHAGYAFITSPPYELASINFGRLLIQLAVVGLITGAWIYVKKGK